MSLFASAKAPTAALSGLAAVVFLAAFSAFADTITVTSTGDGGPGSLRDAIARAADGDTIDFSVPLPNTIAISESLTIESMQSKTLTIKSPGGVRSWPAIG